MVDSCPDHEKSRLSLSPPLWVRAVLFCVSYFLLALLGSFLAMKPGPFINFWLPSGLFVATLLRHGSRTWPAFILAAFPANIGFDLLNGQMIQISFLFYCGNCLEALTGAWLVRRFVAESPNLTKVKELLGLTVLSALLSTTISATIGALIVTKGIGVGSFGEIWMLWWSGDVLGILLLAPVILSWRKSLYWGSSAKPSAKLIETFGFMILLGLSAVYILKDDWHQNVALKYFFIPFLIWAAYRFGVRGTAVSALWVALLATWYTITGLSDIARVGLTAREQVTALQLFLAVITLTGLFLATALAERRRAEEALQESEERFRIIASNTPDHLLVQDRDLRYSLVMNPQLGLTEKDMIGKLDYDFLSQDDAKKLTALKRQVLESGKPIQVEVPLTNLQGEDEFFEGSYISKFNKEGQIDGLIGYFRNVTKRKQAEKALVKSEEKFRNLFNSAQVGIFRTKIDGSEILDFNEKYLEIFNRTREEMIHLPSVIHWFDLGEREEMVRRLEAEGQVTDFECRMKTKQGQVKRCLTSLKIYPEQGILEGSIIDISERKEAEEKIQASLKEKEVLLKEIHHRVKNNLAVISSIIRLQARQVEDRTSQEILRECENRVQSMSKIHSKIYQSKDLSGIDFDSYLMDLAKDLFRSYRVNTERVKVNLQVSALKPDLETTVPLCLILNELMSNALKYAFPEGKEGLISIRLQREEGRITLTVSDNGSGFPEDLDFRNTKSLGLQLVMALVKQLHGTIEMQRDGGTVFLITFQEKID